MGVLKTLTNEYFGSSIRMEDGISIKLNNKQYFIKYEDYDFIKNLQPMNEKGDLFIEKNLFDKTFYICCVYYKKKYFEEYEYYTISKEQLEEINGNIIPDNLLSEFADANYDMNSDNFLPIKIISNSVGKIFNIHNNDLFIDYYTMKKEIYHIENGKKVYEIYDSLDKINMAYKDAIYDDLCKRYGDEMYKDDVKIYVDYYGKDWLEKETIEEDYVENYTDELWDKYNDDNGPYGNRLFEELYWKNLIQDTSEYFEVDSDKPKFEIEDYRDELVDSIIKNDNLSKEEAENKINTYGKTYFINCLVYNNIIKRTEEYFELDYHEPKFDVDEMVDKLVEYKLSTTDIVEDFINSTSPLDCKYYDLYELSKKIAKESKFSEYLGKEYKYEINNITYYIYEKDS